MAAGEFTLDEVEKKKKAALEQQHGCEVYCIRGDVGPVWCRGPKFDEIFLFMDEQMSDKKKGSAAIEQMGRALLEPSTDPRMVFAKRPGAMIPYSQAYAKAAGITADAELGK